MTKRPTSRGAFLEERIARALCHIGNPHVHRHVFGQAHNTCSSYIFSRSRAVSITLNRASVGIRL